MRANERSICFGRRMPTSDVSDDLLRIMIPREPRIAPRNQRHPRLTRCRPCNQRYARLAEPRKDMCARCVYRAAMVNLGGRCRCPYARLRGWAAATGSSGIGMTVIAAPGLDLLCLEATEREDRWEGALRDRLAPMTARVAPRRNRAPGRSGDQRSVGWFEVVGPRGSGMTAGAFRRDYFVACMVAVRAGRARLA
jgi:hypothetical protein